jgi:hypothetical protein
VKRTFAACAALVACTSLDGLSSAPAPTPRGDDGGACGSPSDPKNCGRCGHDCLGGACDQGTCGPVTLAVGAQAPEDIATLDGAVYWTNYGNGTVLTVAASGGAPSAIAEDHGGARGIAAANGRVVWVASAAGTVHSFDAATRMLSPVATGQAGIFDVTLREIDGARVPVWTRKEAGLVVTVDAAMTPSSIATAQRAPGAITSVSADTVCWVNEGTAPAYADGSIACTSGATTRIILADVARPRGITAYGRTVYFTAAGDGTVRSFEEGTPVRIIARDQSSPAGIAADISGVYWVNETAGGSLMQLPDGAASAVTMRAGLENPHALTTDAVAVYWTNLGTTASAGTVMKLAK